MIKLLLFEELILVNSEKRPRLLDELIDDVTNVQIYGKKLTRSSLSFTLTDLDNLWHRSEFVGQS